MAHILLVEPDISLGKLYTSSLELSGYSVSHCRTAQDAITSADENIPDLVLLEIEIAIHNGIEFLYDFRSYPEWQDIPLLIVSHVVPSRGALNPKSWGLLKISGYHYKPITKLQDLLSSVERVLSSDGVKAL